MLKRTISLRLGEMVLLSIHYTNFDGKYSTLNIFIINYYQSTIYTQTTITILLLANPEDRVSSVRAQL